MKTAIAAILILLLTTQPVLAAYTLRPYDILKISVLNQSELTTEQTITPDGQISLPFMGLFHVADLTLNQLEAQYKRTLSPYVQKPQIIILLKPAPIYIVQNNLKDSTFSVKLASSTTEALALAGGTYSSTIQHGDTLEVYQGEHIDWWEKNWYRVITATAVVTGVYLGLRR